MLIALKGYVTNDNLPNPLVVKMRNPILFIS